jgi:hypothetical protein
MVQSRSPSNVNTQDETTRHRAPQSPRPPPSSPQPKSHNRPYLNGRAWLLRLGVLILFTVLLVINVRLIQRNQAELEFERESLQVSRNLVNFVSPKSSVSSVRNETTTTTKHSQDDEFDATVAELLSVKEPLPNVLEPKSGRPPYDTIVSTNGTIEGDASWLLNFAVVGFPKCGTSTLMLHLHMTSSNLTSNSNVSSTVSASLSRNVGLASEVELFPEERCDLGGNQQVRLIHDLYHDMIPGPQYIRGLKCPQNLESAAMALPVYSKYFPHTKFIVGVRHPVLWFQSFYNFRIQNRFPLKSPNELIGPCFHGSFGVCTNRAIFHFHLSKLNKTPMSPEEVALMPPSLIRPRRRKNSTASAPPPINFTAPVFLYEVSQLSDSDSMRNIVFRQDLQNFLGLQADSVVIEPFIWYKPGKNHSDPTVLDAINRKKINICDPQYNKLRERLMEHATKASTWIAEYFIQSPTVYVSSPHHFVHSILAKWKIDPCDAASSASLAT